METSSSSTAIFSSNLFSRMKSEDRSALIDITNDSPIVGLATGSLKTPMSKKKRLIGRVQSSTTPGSGEALLRGQVKTLLQKVEEEAELSKVENRPFLNLLKSVVAPTPQILIGGASSCLPPFLIPQMVLSEKKKGEGSVESEDLITRSLLREFSEKSSDSLSSALTYDVDDDDAASLWSIQANASSTRDEEEDYCDHQEKETVDRDDDPALDDLCEGISKISVTEFCGKHIRFVYG